MKYINSYNENLKYREYTLVDDETGEMFILDFSGIDHLLKMNIIKWNPDFNCFTFNAKSTDMQYLWTYLTGKGYRKIKN